MALINELFGPRKGRSAPRKIPDVEAAIGRLADERRAAREHVADTLRRREQMLLVDGTDDKIAEIDAETDSLRLKLERLDKAEPLLVDELQSLRAEARREKWRDICTRYASAADNFAAKLRELIGDHEALSAIIHEARNTGFAAEAATLVLAPRILDRDALARFESELDRARDAAARVAAATKPLALPPSSPPASPPRPSGLHAAAG